MNIDIDKVLGFLRSPRGRLALTYLAIIMVMSVGFSIVFYNTSSHHLMRQLPPRSLYGNSPFVNEFRPGIESFIHQRIKEGQQALLVKLIWLNLVALVFGTALSYILARRTLRPVEEAMEAHSQFVSDASHELRTPLTAIKASNEVALRKPKLNLMEAKKVIKSNTEDVTKLQELTDRLLRLANNKYIPGSKIVPLSIQDVAAQAMNQVIQSAQAKDIAVNNELDNISVLGDKQSLVQIITILLDNAIKYSNPKTTISLDSTVKGKFAYLHVRDHGAGIGETDLKHVFKRFYRIDKSRSKEQLDGYGLGLSIADKLIGQLHGEILVESTVGKGSTFTIKLPLVKSLS